MPLYDGNKMAQDGLLHVAQHCAQATLHAPQVTGLTKIKMEIVEGEELEDYFKVQDVANENGARFSGETYKQAYKMGEPPVILLIGADVTPIVEAPCKATCPAGIDVPRYIRLIGDGKYDEAVAVIREKIPLPSICAYACYAPCEKKCRRGMIRDEPVAIKALKRFAVDNAKDEETGSHSTKNTGKRVAIIGSGPSGLTAAYYLRKVCGHEVTIFEALSQPGGMMRAGIPEKRLPRDILDKEIEAIEQLGVEIKLNSKQESLDRLFKDGYDAVFVSIGAGAPKGKNREIQGEDFSSVIKGFGLSMGKENRIHIDPDTCATDREGVFAGGDAVTGRASVIKAIAAGRKAASFIDKYVGGLGIIDEVLAPPEQIPEVSPAQKAAQQTKEEPKRPEKERLKEGLSEQEALLETTRCLKCEQIGFDCGACGFKTCREAVIFCQDRLNETGGEPWGWLQKGPSCIWRAFDFGISVDWAEAAAHRLNIESRAGMIPATAFMRMGYMEGCSFVIAVPLGPCKERWYFEPGTGREKFSPFEKARRNQMLLFPPLWTRFCGPGRDQGKRGINVKDKWWEPPYTRLEIVEDQEWGDFALDRDYAIFEVADEIRKKRKVKRLNLPKIKKTLDGKKSQ